MIKSDIVSEEKQYESLQMNALIRSFLRKEETAIYKSRKESYNAVKYSEAETKKQKFDDFEGDLREIECADILSINDKVIASIFPFSIENKSEYTKDVFQQTLWELDNYIEENQNQENQKIELLFPIQVPGHWILGRIIIQNNKVESFIYDSSLLNNWGDDRLNTIKETIEQSFEESNLSHIQFTKEVTAQNDKDGRKGDEKTINFRDDHDQINIQQGLYCGGLVSRMIRGVIKNNDPYTWSNISISEMDSSNYRDIEARLDDSSLVNQHGVEDEKRSFITLYAPASNLPRVSPKTHEFKKENRSTTKPIDNPKKKIKTSTKIKVRPSHVNDAQDDTGQPKFLITNYNWVVSLVRIAKNHASEHAFIIIEAIDRDEDKVFFIDFSGSSNDYSAADGDALIQVEEYPKQNPNSKKPLLFQSGNKLMKVQENTTLQGFSWNISCPESKKIIKNARDQITSPPKYNILGGSALPAIKFKFIDKSEAHNCFTWARKLLNDSILSHNKKLFSNLESMNDIIVSRSSRYLRDRMQPKTILEEGDINIIYNIEENADFIGRELDLDKLEEVFFPKQLQENDIEESKGAEANEIPRKVVSQKEIGVITHGAGGIGKSSIARQYAQEHKEIHQVVFSIDISGQTASTEDAKKNLDAGFRKLAYQLNNNSSQLGIIEITNINEDEAAQESIRQQVYERLGQLGGKQLLIFDDAKDYKSIKEFLPQSNDNHNVQVIITSRNADLNQWKEVTPVELDTFPPEVSMLHLLRGVAKTQNKEESRQVINPDGLEKMISKFLNNTKDVEELSNQEIKICESAQSLAKTLHNYPLALTHAVAYMNNYPKLSIDRTIFSKYERLYGDPKNKDLTEGETASDYELTMSASLKLSTDKLKESNKEEYDLMMMLSMMNNKDLDENLITSCLLHIRGNSKGNIDKDRITKAIKLLKSHSLITGEKSPFQIHDMVKDTLISNLRNDKIDFKEYWTDVLITLNEIDEIRHLGIAITFYKNIWEKTQDRDRKLLINSYRKLTLFATLIATLSTPSCTSESDLISKSDLYMAIMFSNLELCKYLVEKGADVNAKDNNGETFLHLAVFGGDLELCKYLVEKGLDVNAKDNNGRTILRTVITGDDPKFRCNSNLELCKYLVEKGADVNAKDNNGRTILHWATFHSNLAICKLLVEKGADVNAKDNNGRTLLYMAAFNNNLELCILLVEKGSDVNFKDNDGETLLHRATFNDNLAICKLLVEKGADVNAKDNNGRTILHMVKFSGNLAICKLLVEKGADVNFKDNDGETFLRKAAFSGNLELCRFLVEKGADVNFKDNDGETFLHKTAFSGNLELCRFLVEKGADVNAQDNDGETVLHKVITSDDAKFSSNLELYKFLVEKGADVNVKDNDGETILHMVAFNSNLKLCKFLLEKDADVNAKDNNGRTILHWAAFHSNLAICKLLVEKGADVNAQDNYGQTFLPRAAFSGNLELCILLVEKGADVNFKDNDGETILHKAAFSGNLELCILLVEKGLDVNAKNNDGETVLHKVIKSDDSKLSTNLELYQYLVEKGALEQSPNTSIKANKTSQITSQICDLCILS